MKTCVKCYKNKPLDEFALNKKSKDGRSYDCKKCHREYVTEYYKLNPRKSKSSSLNRYGITIEDYEILFDKQKGVCAICSKPETRICTQGMVQSLSVDHDHETGLIRGLLCDRCNKAIGLFYHDLDLLTNAIEYLVVS